MNIKGLNLLEKNELVRKMKGFIKSFYIRN